TIVGRPASPPPIPALSLRAAPPIFVWVLTGFMGATYWMVPDESRTELHSTKLAYIQLVLWTLMGVTAVISYLFGYGTGNKLLERSEEHTSELQSRENLVCRLLPETK